MGENHRENTGAPKMKFNFVKKNKMGGRGATLNLYISNNIFKNSDNRVLSI